MQPLEPFVPIRAEGPSQEEPISPNPLCVRGLVWRCMYADQARAGAAYRRKQGIT